MTEIALRASNSQTVGKIKSKTPFISIPLFVVDQPFVASKYRLVLAWSRVDVYRQVNGLFSHTAKLKGLLLLVRPV